MKNTSRVGFLAGFMAILLITFFYTSAPHLLVSGYVEFRLLILFGAIIYGLYNMKSSAITASNIQELAKQETADSSNDFVSFTELLSAGFKIYAIGFVMTFVYIYVLFNYIDPSLIDMVKDETVRINIQYKDPKIAEAVFQQQIKNLKAENFAPTLSSFFSLMNMFKLVIGFILSFIVALFLRRDQPNY